MRESPRPAGKGLEVLLLLVSPAVLLAPLWLRPAGLAAWALLWLRFCRPPRRERWLAGLALACAVAAAGLDALPLAARAEAPESGPSPALRAAYRATWAGLQSLAAEGVGALGTPTDDPEYQRQAFDRLSALAARAPAPVHLRLLDPDGVARAWAGDGLVHEPDPGRLPPRGPMVVGSFGSISFLEVEPFAAPAAGGRGWRLLAGRTYAVSPPGFLPAPPPEGSTWHVSFPEPGEGDLSGWTIAEPGLPPLRLEAEPGRSDGKGPAVSSIQARVAAWALALALLAVAVLRGVGGLLLRGTILATTRPWRLSGAAAAAALVAWAMGASVPWPLATALLLAALLVTLAAGVTVDRWRGATADLLAVAGVVGAWLFAWGVERWGGPLPPLDRHWLGATATAWRLGPALLVAAGLLAAVRLGPQVTRRGRALAGGAALLLTGLAAATADWTWIATASLLLAAVATRRLASPWKDAGGAGVIGFGVAAALLAGTALEITGRAELRRSLPEVLDRFAPPGADRLAGLARRLEAHFAGLDVARIGPQPAASLERFDLAFTLWRSSPLARSDALSALSVQVPGERPSVFAFGLPLTSAGELDREPARWAEVALPGWEQTLVGGEAWLKLRSDRWALARFWLMPQPGFAEPAPPVTDLGANLLRGGPAQLSRRLIGPRPEERLAIFSPDGRALLSPWREEAPRLRPPDGTGVERVSLSTPDGPTWGVARRAPWGTLALLVPRLSWNEGVERAATLALGLSAWALALLGAILLLALPRAAARDFAVRAVRSYSRRLLLLFTGLVLIPSVALYALLTGALGRRLERQQRADGEVALNSAQRVLGEYLVTLEPGFGLDTALDDPLLTWLSRVVQHEVNLYWGGELYASSRRELFTSGLLPRRIPGEVQARLALFGDDLASRDSRAGGATYRELYAPLRVPGVPVERGRLFLSMPLLAQQEELAAELDRLRRRALLVASALFGGLSVLGLRLARNFTRPLDELVESTRRIAAGEPALALQPRELELAALVEAVDRMARRIAEGRERLLREKQVVERIVENVTSGVVSVDYSGRVQLANRAARQMLGIEPGVELRAALVARPELSPLVDFLAEPGGELAQRMLRLAGEGGRDQEWAVVRAPVPGDGEVASLLIIEDATEVLRGQRLAAWAEMARIIAHEIKNPLTPIRLSTEFLREVWQRDRARFPEALERCTANILKQVDELRDIAAEFATYSRVPRLERQPGDLAALVREVVDAYSVTAGSGVEVRLEAPEALPCRFDRRLLGRALRNLLENALRASPPGSAVEVELSGQSAAITLSVSDRGPGVPEELLSRIFEPYFSTHAGGTGLGLPIARRIAEEHGGSLVAHPRAGGGLVAVITMPAS